MSPTQDFEHVWVRMVTVSPTIQSRDDPSVSMGPGPRIIVGDDRRTRCRAADSRPKAANQRRAERIACNKSFNSNRHRIDSAAKTTII